MHLHYPEHFPQSTRVNWRRAVVQWHTNLKTSLHTNKELNNCNITAQVPGEQGTTGVFTRQSTTVSARVRYQEASSSGGAAISTGADVARDKRSVQLAGTRVSPGGADWSGAAANRLEPKNWPATQPVDRRIINWIFEYKCVNDDPTPSPAAMARINEWWENRFGWTVSERQKHDRFKRFVTVAFNYTIKTSYFNNQQSEIYWMYK